jgi:hypothetical protein
VANRVKRVNTTINGNLKHAAELQQWLYSYLYIKISNSIFS